MNLKSFGVFLAFASFVPLAQARVFEIEKESFAAYLRGSFSPTPLINTLNSDSKGNGVNLDSQHPYNISGEFGFVYSTPSVDLRFGLEVIRPPDLKAQSGVDAGATNLYSLTSEVSVLAPKISAEFTVKKWTESKLYVQLGAGYASLAARNSYAFTAAGKTQFGLNDFYEDLRAGAPLYEGSFGFESYLTNATTYVIEGGYRALNFTSVKHNSVVTTFQGPVTKGSAATNMDGSNRSFNLSNYFVGFALRFWLN